MWVRAMRGGETESVHRVIGVVVGLAPHEETRFGEPETLTYWRSSMKPFQAIPVVADGAAERFGFTPADMALCCASHGGTPEHVERAASMLERLDLDVSALACGAHRPFEEEAARDLARAGRDPTRLHNNCSGKHAGMLALARRHGWETAGYERPDHPVQARIREELGRWLDVGGDELTWGGDGCGVPSPYLSLRQMARAYARLGRTDDPSARAVVEAMTAHPNVVGGSCSLSTALMSATGGRLLGKEGAEGVFCATEPGAGWGAALKVVDGGKRALAPALLEMLATVGLLRDEELERLAERRAPAVRDSRGHRVGDLRAEARPHRAAVAASL